MPGCRPIDPRSTPGRIAHCCNPVRSRTSSMPQTPLDSGFCPNTFPSYVQSMDKFVSETIQYLVPAILYSPTSTWDTTRRHRGPRSPLPGPVLYFKTRRLRSRKSVDSLCYEMRPTTVAATKAKTKAKATTMMMMMMMMMMIAMEFVSTFPSSSQRGPTPAFVDPTILEVVAEKRDGSGIFSAARISSSRPDIPSRTCSSRVPFPTDGTQTTATADSQGFPSIRTE